MVIVFILFYGADRRQTAVTARPKKINDLDDVFVLVFVYLRCSGITSFLDINLLSYFGIVRSVMYDTETLGRGPERGRLGAGRPGQAAS